jgi:hypothetical protein
MKKIVFPSVLGNGLIELAACAAGMECVLRLLDPGPRTGSTSYLPRNFPTFKLEKRIPAEVARLHQSYGQILIAAEYSLPNVSVAKQ